MKKIKITFPDREERIFTFKELGLEENATEEEISQVVDEQILQNVS